jgi:hypothetical protein
VIEDEVRKAAFALPITCVIIKLWSFWEPERISNWKAVGQGQHLKPP